MRLTIENFKGIPFLNQDLGKLTTISGANKSGKTTVLSAIVWCLTGVDLYGIDNPKPQGIERPEPTTVAITLSDGQSYCRTLAEKWTKNRQTLDYEYQGNETTYLVNGEKVKKADFEKAVSGGGAFLLKGLTLRESLLSMMLPGYFPADLDEKKRRAVIADLVNISNKDKLELAKELNFDSWDAPGIADKLRAEVKNAEKNVEAKAAVKRDIETQLNEYSDLPDADKLKAETEELRAKERELITADGREAKKQRILADMKATEATFAAKKQLWDTEEQKKKIVAENENQQKQSEWKAKFEEIHADYLQAKVDYNNKKAKYDTLKAQKERKQNDADWYAVKYRELENRRFDADLCPITHETCQRLAESAEIEEQRKKFNLEKAQMLEEYRTRGMAADAEVEKLKKELDELENLQKPEPPEFPPQPEKVFYTPQPFPAVNDYLEDLKGELAMVENEEEDPELSKIKAAIAKNEETAAKIAIKDNLAKRHADISAELDDLKKLYQQSFRELELAKDYALRLSQLAKSRAKSAIGFDVRLNQPTIDGDLRPVCVFVDAKGVNFNSINTAARINNGIAICDRLAERCGHIFPILVDNAEAVNELNTNVKSEMVVAKVSEDQEIIFS